MDESELEELKNELDEATYAVCFGKATEPPFSGRYHDCKENGAYSCACCGEMLFDSDTKFDSGTGWPSFWKPMSEDAVVYSRDTSYGMLRVEVSCRRCGAHLGHVFSDGPMPTNLRYCINSASLNLKRRK